LQKGLAFPVEPGDGPLAQLDNPEIRDSVAGLKQQQLQNPEHGCQRSCRTIRHSSEAADSKFNNEQ
jgi:hypothetical protein